MIRCSAHYNNLSLAVSGILETALVCVPASVAMYIQMTLVNKIMFWIGGYQTFSIDDIPGLRRLQ